MACFFHLVVDIIIVVSAPWALPAHYVLYSIHLIIIYSCLCIYFFLFPHNLREHELALPFLAGIWLNCRIDCLILNIAYQSLLYWIFCIVLWVLFSPFVCVSTHHSKRFRINNEIRENNNETSVVDDWNLHMFENNNDKKKLKLTLIECVYVFLLLLLRCCCYDDVVDIRNTLCSFVANFARVRALSAA